MASNFKRSEILATTSRNAVYGPVPANTTGIVFAGTFANVDNTSKTQHTVTLEILNTASNFVPVLFKIPVPFGGSAKCPKIVLAPTESLHVSADTNEAIHCSINVLERT